MCRNLFDALAGDKTDKGWLAASSELEKMAHRREDEPCVFESVVQLYRHVNIKVGERSGERERERGGGGGEENRKQNIKVTEDNFTKCQRVSVCVCLLVFFSLCVCLYLFFFIFIIFLLSFFFRQIYHTNQRIDSVELKFDFCVMTQYSQAQKLTSTLLKAGSV